MLTRDGRGSDEIEGFTAGVFLIDKPPGVSSFSVIRDVRRLLGIKKVGHAGTLDPFATGLLLVCAGRPATRLIDRLMAGKKVYRAVLQLGRQTETLDPEGEVVQTAPVPELDADTIKTCLSGFIGRQMQTPPRYSAAKHMGKPLYHYARKGIEVIKEPKEIEIFSLDFIGYNQENQQLEVEVVCSRGTYIRALAADIGGKLGSCAYLTELRRLGSGGFSVADSLPGQLLRQPGGLQRLLADMIPPECIEATHGREEGAGPEAAGIKE